MMKPEADRLCGSVFSRATVLLLVCMVPFYAYANDDYGTWSYSTDIILNTSATGANVTGSVSDFPVLIRLDPGNFTDFAHTNDNGSDIRFASSGGTHLPYHIERWVDNGGNADSAWIWVKSSVSGNSSSQYIVMYWGNVIAADSSNREAVFDVANGFAGVWHLNEDPAGGSGAIKDVTSNMNDGTSTGGMTTENLVGSQIGRGIDFDGMDDGIEVPDAVPLDFTNQLSVSLWFKADALNAFEKLAIKSHTANTSPYTMYGISIDDASHLRAEMADGGISYTLNGISTLSTGTWYYANFTYDGSDIRLYLDGVLDNSTSHNGTIDVNNQYFTIGKAGYNMNYFDGVIDNLRLSNTVRSGDWIKLCYENQREAQTLVEIQTPPQDYTWDYSSSPGFQASSGTWGADDYWSLSGGDGTLPGSWPGTDATATFAGGDGSWAVTISGTQYVDSLTFLNDGYMLDGGTSIDLGTGKGIYVESGKFATISTPISGTGGLTKSGDGQLTLSGTNTYTGNTVVKGGVLDFDGGFIAAGSAVTSESGTGINGSGTVNGALTVNGYFTPGGGLVGSFNAAGGLTLSGTATCILDVTGPTTPGTDYDQINVTGGVTPGSAALDIVLGYTPSVSDAYTIIDNDAADAVSGTFNGLAEGGDIIVSYGGSAYRFTISYVGGTGNDVVLTCTEEVVDYTWDTDGSGGILSGNGIWGSDNFWTVTTGDGTILTAWPGAGKTATFGGSDGTWTITVSGTQYADSLTFLNNGYTLTGGTSVDLGTKKGIYVESGMSATISTPLYSTGGLLKNGAGTLILDGSNSLTGTVTINEGTLQLTGTGTLPGTEALVIADAVSTVLDLNGNTGSVGSIAGGGGTGGSITLGSGQLTAGADNTSTTFAGIISGTGTFIKEGTGTLTLTGANTYTGMTTINSGVLQIGDGGTSGELTGDIYISAGATLLFNRSDPYTYSGAITGDGSVVQSGSGTITLTGVNTWTGGTTVDAGCTLQIGDGTTTGEITSSISNSGTVVFNHPDPVSYAGAISGTGSLTKSGTGTLTLTGNSTYEGGTTVDGGILQIGNGAAMGSIDGDVTNNGAVVFNRSDAVNFSGIISGTGTVTQSGASTLTLSGNNTYTGGTTISSGTLQIGDGGMSGEVAGDITNVSSLVFNRSDTYIYGGVISDVGTVTQAGTGTLILTGANTGTGAVTVTSGTLQIGNGGAGGEVIADITTTTALVFNRSDPLTYSGMISGAGTVTQSGSGTVTLTGANTYSGATTVDMGATLQVGDGGSMGEIPGNISNEGTVVFNRDYYTYSGAITGTGALTQSGTGTLTLTGTSSYSGGTTVDAGATLQIGNAGATGEISGDILNNGTVVFNRSDVVNFGGVISGTGTVTQNGMMTLTFTGNNTYTGATTISNGTLQIGDGGMSGEVAGDITNLSALYFNRSDDYTYNGVISDVGTVTQAGTGTLILTGDNTCTGAFTITTGTLQIGSGGMSGEIAGDIYDESALVFNRSDNLTMYGSIYGAGSVTQSGTGTVILAGANTYTGATTVDMGATLQIGDGSINGIISSDISNSGAVVFNRSDDITYSGIISGSGTLTKSGIGTLILDVSHTYTGTTTVGDGTLRIAGPSGALASGSTVDVSSGTLSGAGSVNGSVNVTGTLAPGDNTTGTLATGSLVTDPAAVLDFEIGTTWDQVTVGGDLTLDGTLNISETTGFAAGTYQIITYSGTLTDNGLEIGTTPAGYDYEISQSAGVIEIVISAIPMRTWIGGGGDNLWSNSANWSGGTLPATADSVIFPSSAAYPCDLTGDVTVKCLMMESGYTYDVNLNGYKMTVTGRLSVASDGNIVNSGGDVIAFGGSDPMLFEPKAGMAMPTILQEGTGTTTVQGNAFTTDTLSIADGVFHCGSGLSHTINDTLFINGGTLKLGTSTLQISGGLVTQGGALSFNEGTLQFAGTGGKVDLASLTALSLDTGKIEFNGTGTALFTLSTASGQVCPSLQINGTSTDTVRFLTDVNASSVRQTGSVLDWGEGLSHSVDTIVVTSSGEMDFGSSVVAPGKRIELTGLTALEPGTGQLAFSATSGEQLLVPPSGLTCPPIVKTGNGIFALSGGALICGSLNATGGQFNFNTYDVTVNGDFSLTGGTSTTVSELYGVTLTVSGNATFSGQSGNLLNLDAASAWSVNVTGDLTASYATIGNCTATGSPGYALDNCVDAGGNTEWYFDTAAPDNDMTLAVTALSTTSLQLSWNPEAVDSGDAAAVKFWYKTTGLPDSAHDEAADSTAEFTLSSSPQVITGLTPQTPYYFVVAVRDEYNNWSEITSAAIDSEYTFADPPVAGTGPGTVHKKRISMTWINPTGLTPADSIYIHYDTASGAYGWTHDTTLAYDQSSCDATLPLSGEGSWRVMVSTSFDSAGIRHIEDALVYDFDYAIDPPVLTSDMGTTPRRKVTFTYTVPAGMTTDDSVYIHHDTIDGSVWTIDTTIGSTVASVDILLPAAEGVYRYAVSTSFDSLGAVDAANMALDTVTLEILPPVITTENDTVGNLTPPVTWSAPAGMTTGDKFHIYTDTVTGANGWDLSGVYEYPVDSMNLSFPVLGRYLYRITTSFDSLAEIEVANGAVDTITIIDVVGPSGGSLAISDKNGYTADADPALTLGATDADSMRIALAGDSSDAAWKAFATLDSIDISAGGEGKVSLFVQFMDIADNRTGWIYDTTVYDTTSPATVVEVSGSYGTATWPDMIEGNSEDTLSGTDSVFITIYRILDTTWWNGTAWQSTESRHMTAGSEGWSVALPDTNLTEGDYVVAVTAKDSAGNITVPADSVTFSYYTMPEALFIADTDTGAAPLTVTFTGSSTGSVSSRQWTFGDGTSDTASNPVHVFTAAGTYLVRLAVSGPGGSDTSAPLTVMVRDTTPPEPLRGVAVVAENCSTVVISWDRPEDADADSVSVNVSYDAFVTSEDSGRIRRTTAVSDTVATITGIPPEGITAYVSTFVLDKSGNWSNAGTGSRVSVQLDDCVAPDYLLSVGLQMADDSTLRATLDVDTADSIIETVVAGYGMSRDGASGTLAGIPYNDTVLDIGTGALPGWWFVATAVEDASGNRSVLHFDSLKVQNAPPAVTFTGDTVLLEDTLWQAEVTATDINGDAVTLTLTSGPEKLMFDGALLEWTPGDSDIGEHLIIVGAEDSRDGSTLDTLRIMVNNREEPPVLQFTGDTLVEEEHPYRCWYTVNDPDPDDSYTLELNGQPAWLKQNGDTLSGTPAEDDDGTFTLAAVVTDNSGLKDTLKSVIVVKNVNDTPVVVSGGLPDTVIEKKSAEVVFVVHDPDADDTLSVDWTRQYSWITASVSMHDASKRQWAVTVAMTPAQKDTGRVPVTLRILDRAGAAVEVNDTIIVPDADDPPEPPTIIRQVAGGAVQYTLSSKDDRDTELLYTVVLQSLDDTGFTMADRSTGGVFRFYPLEDGRYLLSATAIDRVELESDTVRDTLTITGASRYVTADTLWTMFSVPARFETARLERTKYLLHWDESISERQLYHYYLQKHEIDEMEQGKSYWRKGSDRDTIRVTRDQMADAPVEITLKKGETGWNQIASPYPYPVVWKGKSSVLWKWNPESGDFDESDSILEPWAGYWVQSDVTGGVTVDTVPWFGGKKLAKRKRSWFNGQSNWAVRLVLSANGRVDGENRIGMLPTAKDGYDRNDRPEPPHIADGARLFFPRTGWKRGITEYASDIRRKWSPINIFEFAVSGSAKTGAGVIRFEGIDKGTPLYLFITSGDTIRQVSPGEELTVPLSSSVCYRTLFVVDNPAVMNMLPLRFNMANPYPNPFCPSTRINYVLPYRWGKDGKMVGRNYIVSIDIYDIKGRKIRNLVYRRMTPGSYSVFWDGKSSSGRVVASGHYYCRLKADKFQSVRNLILVR